MMKGDRIQRLMKIMTRKNAVLEEKKRICDEKIPIHY